MRFDACADAYDAHARPQRDFAARVAEFAEVRPDDDLLEFGAGTGALTRHLTAIQGVHVCATDISPAMVALGKTAVPEADWVVLMRSPRLCPRVRCKYLPAFCSGRVTRLVS